MKKLLSTALLATAGAALLPCGVGAQNVTFNPGDLILGFRETGRANDLVIDLGQASLFSSPAHASFNLTGLSIADINAVFGSINNVSWGVAGVWRLGSPTPPPINTLFTTTTRPSLSTPSSPLTQASSQSQQNVGAKIESIGDNFSGSPATANSSTATIQNASLSYSYNSYLGSGGNFGGTYLAANGSIETTTPANFSSGGVQYEDLYELQPGSGPGTLIGTFALGSGGTMTFTAAPEPSALTLMGGAAAGLLFLRFRRRASKP
ncbi:MAG TPA: hypothetical protein VN281_20425 [Verrucomicrobiae bacterium]|nr:hypothetical protein [Verrucomicrobiae bacterium]